MPQDDEMQVGVFYERSGAEVAVEGALPVEMGGGEGNLIRIWACHWTVELVKLADTPSVDRFLGLALSSNPEHELVHLVNFQDFQSNKALYARALWTYNSLNVLIAGSDNVINREALLWQPKKVPCYGLVRPRRQMMVWSLLNGAAVTGMGLEIYYTPFSATRTEREEVNRKYGKYRRS